MEYCRIERNADRLSIHGEEHALALVFFRIRPSFSCAVRASCVGAIPMWGLFRDNPCCSWFASGGNDKRVPPGGVSPGTVCAHSMGAMKPPLNSLNQCHLHSAFFSFALVSPRLSPRRLPSLGGLPYISSLVPIFRTQPVSIFGSMCWTAKLLPGTSYNTRRY